MRQELDIKETLKYLKNKYSLMERSKAKRIIGAEIDTLEWVLQES